MRLPISIQNWIFFLISFDLWFFVFQEILLDRHMARFLNNMKGFIDNRQFHFHLFHSMFYPMNLTPATSLWARARGSWPYQWNPVVVTARPVSGWRIGDFDGSVDYASASGSYPYQWNPVVVTARPVSGWRIGDFVGSLDYASARGSYPYQWKPVVVTASPVSGWRRGKAILTAEVALIKRAMAKDFIFYLLFYFKSYFLH